MQRGVRFTVADSGMGMDAEARKRAFEAFYTTKENTGTGLGLWVSLEILNKHHGTVHLRSRTADAGKTSGQCSNSLFLMMADCRCRPK